MTRKPLVTVFMPVYNSEQYLKEAIESIINQTYKNLELLLVDDGSTDSSVDIINSFSDERIRLIKNKQNMGIPFTRNVGLKEANGKYIAIMDSDDIALPTRIEKQVEFMEKNKHIDAAGSYYYQFGGKFMKKVKSPFIRSDELKIMLLFYNPIANPSVILRKETFEKYKLRYNLDFFVAQDYEMWSQIIKVGNLCIIPEYLLKYRFGHDNITKKSFQEKLNKRIQLIDRIHRDLLYYFGFNLDEEEIKTFNDFFTESYKGRVSSIENLKKVIRKLREINQKQKIFEHTNFDKILDYCIVIALEHQRLPVKLKLNLYNELSTHKHMKDRLQLFIKHYYHEFLFSRN